MLKYFCTTTYHADKLRNAGLTTKLDFLFSKWKELSDIHDEMAKAWDERLETFTSKTNSNGLENTSKKQVNVVQNVKKVKGNVFGQVGTVTIGKD